MDLGSLVFDLPSEYKKSIRKLEKTTKKVVETESALVFNQTCLKENLLPTYTNIYICIYIRDVQSEEALTILERKNVK